MVSPSEQVDHVWHLHQTHTKEYREDCNKIFGGLFNHCPALGGKEDAVKFKGGYNKTLEFYEKIFKRKPKPELWEATDERFSPDLFNCSNVNLMRLATYTIYKCK